MLHVTPNTEDLIAKVLQETGTMGHRNLAIRFPPLRASHSKESLRSFKDLMQ